MKKEIRVNEYMDLNEEHRLSEAAYRGLEEERKTRPREKDDSDHPVLEKIVEIVGELIFALLEGILESL